MSVVFGKRNSGRVFGEQVLSSALKALQTQNSFPQPSGDSVELPTQVIVTSNWGHNTAPDQCPPDVDGISRLQQLSQFAGANSDVLRAAIGSPDSRLNIAQTEETFATMNRRMQQKLKEVFDGLNETSTKIHPELKIRAGLILPERLWRSKYRNFLCAAGQFYPTDPTNIFVLAATPMASEAMGLPLDFDYGENVVYESCEKFIAFFGEKYLAAKRELEEQTKNRDEIIRRIQLGLIHDKEALKEWTEIAYKQSPTEEHMTIAEEGLRTLGTVVLPLRFDCGNAERIKQLNRETELFGSQLDRTYSRFTEIIETARSADL
jgi:hypothetical protein